MFDESLADAWSLRYGQAAPDLPDLGRFLNHRSVRTYSGRPIEESTLQGLIASAQSAATSSNLQLWSVIRVQDSARRNEIAELCGDQKQIRDCAEFLCFFADHHRLRTAAARVGEASEGLSFAEFFIMAVIDAALAAERLVCAAEAQGIGICYIGALRNDAQGVSAFFDLPKGVFGLFGLCLGYPNPDRLPKIKPRLSQESVCFSDRYPTEIPVAEYDERMAAFYEAERMKGDVTWSMRSGRKVDLHHMTGRDTLLGWLRSQGFLLN